MAISGKSRPTPDRILDGYGTPDEEADFLNPQEEQELARLECERAAALAREDMREADRLNQAIKDLFTLRKDRWGFWV